MLLRKNEMMNMSKRENLLSNFNNPLSWLKTNIANVKRKRQ